MLQLTFRIFRFRAVATISLLLVGIVCVASHLLGSLSHNITVKGEPLSRAMIDKQKLIAEVTSHGCTHAADFQLQLEQTDKVTYIWLERQRPDYCRKKAFALEVKLLLPNGLQQKRLQLLNPIS